MPDLCWKRKKAFPTIIIVSAISVVQSNQMTSFDFNEYSEEGRRVLKKVVEEIREQYFASGLLPQFWFHPAQASDRTLTEPIVQKWLQVLAEKGALHFYKPPYGSFEYEQALALGHGCLNEDYAWERHMLTPFITGFPPDSFPGFALDIYDTNLDQLIESASKKTILGKFQKDSLDRYSYGGAPLIDINNSPLRKAVLEEFLLADKHTVSAKRVEEILSRSYENVDDHARSRVISETRRALRGVSHEVDIVSHKVGHRVNYYELIFE